MSSRRMAGWPQLVTGMALVDNSGSTSRHEMPCGRTSSEQPHRKKDDRTDLRLKSRVLVRLE